MKYLLATAIAAALTACTTTGGQRMIPSPSTIARIESGSQLVRDLAAAGYQGAEAMNAQSRVKVRLVACVPLGAGGAECSYDASRCADSEPNIDQDGWCPRTSRFVRAKYLRAPFDVIVRGWALDRPTGTTSGDLLADPPITEIIRQNIPICLDPSDECQVRRMEKANAFSDQGLSLVVVATDETGTYAMFRRDFMTRTKPNPRIWVFPDAQKSLLWDLDCQARTFSQVVEIVQNERGLVLSYNAAVGSAQHPKSGSAPSAVVESICKSPVRAGYTHL